ncbi:MAG: GIY-YIG nuclease family protein [bacterium]
MTAGKRIVRASRHHVYILECADGTLYTGSTSDLVRRLREHNHAKSGAHYTKIRRPVVLRYAESAKTLGEARSREAALKRLTRQEKLALIGK